MLLSVLSPRFSNNYVTLGLILLSIYCLTGYFINIYVALILLVTDIIYVGYFYLTVTPEKRSLEELSLEKRSPKKKISKCKIIKVPNNTSVEPDNFEHNLMLNRQPCPANNCDLETITESSEESALSNVEIETELGGVEMDEQSNSSSIEIESYR